MELKSTTSTLMIFSTVSWQNSKTRKVPSKSHSKKSLWTNLILSRMLHQSHSKSSSRLLIPFRCLVLLTIIISILWLVLHLKFRRLGLIVSLWLRVCQIRILLARQTLLLVSLDSDVKTQHLAFHIDANYMEIQRQLWISFKLLKRNMERWNLKCIQKGIQLSSLKAMKHLGLMEELKAVVFFWEEICKINCSMMMRFTISSCQRAKRFINRMRPINWLLNHINIIRIPQQFLIWKTRSPRWQV